MSWVVVLTVVVGPDTVAQSPWWQSYYLNVGLWSDANAVAAGGVSDLQRLRFTVDRTVGPVRAELAYEHLFTLTGRSGGGVGGGLAAGVTPGTVTWADLQWTIHQRDHVAWRHRFDRLNLGGPSGMRSISPLAARPSRGRPASS